MEQKHSAQIVDMRSEILDMRSENAGMKAKILDMQTENAGMHAKISDMNAEISDMHSENAGMRSENAGMQAKILDMQAENASMHAENAGMQAKIADMNAEISDMNSENAGMKAKITDMHAVQVSQASQIQDLEREQKNSKFAHSVQTAVMQDQLTVMDAQMRKDKAEHLSELAALFATTRVLRYDLQASIVSNENLALQVSAVRAENADLRAVCTNWFRIMRDVHTALGSVWTEDNRGFNSRE